MQVKIENQISDATYEKARQLENYSIYHTKNWHRVLKDSFNWDVKALTIYEGSLIFFLPFITKKRLDLKEYNICLPLSHKIGPAYANREIVESKEQIDLFNKMSNLEVHDRINTSSLKTFSENTIITTNLQSYQNVDSLFDDLDKSSIQRKIRKAQKENVITRVTDKKADFEHFSFLQNITRKKQGSPAYPADFFSNLYHHFKNTNHINLHLAYYEGVAVAGVIFSNFNKRAIYLYGASVDDRNLYRIGINQIVMWNAIEKAFNDGCKVVDFGKTPYALHSLEKYKLKWAGSSDELVYSYSQDMDIPNLDRESKAMLIASSLLEKMPFELFKRLSPILLKVVL
jgi:hypothetical protein